MKKSKPTGVKTIKDHIPCPCGESSDAYAIYSDGHGHCFSCSKRFDTEADGDEVVTPPWDEGKTPSLPIIFDQTTTMEYLPWRGVSKETMAKFGVLTGVAPDGEPIYLRFPYGEKHAKVRSLKEKQFRVEGGEGFSDAPLFGQTVFSAGSGKALTITEGELDALSVYEMLGPESRVISIKGGSSAHRDCSQVRDYINSFEKIYLCLDNDEVGQKAVREIARLFDANRLYHVKLTKFKDANEYLTNGESKEFTRIWWNARRYLPEGIVSSYSEFESIIKQSAVKEGTPYPFPSLTKKTYGLRTGEVVLITALEGIGKTEIVRSIEHALLKNTDDNIALIHLEESKDQNLKRLAGYELGRPAHLPDNPPTDEEIIDAIKTVTGRDERLHLYSHFGSTDPDVILDVIRVLVSSLGCKWVCLDHITMVVSGLGEDDERKTLDRLSTRLAMLVEELDFGLILVSHINDEGRTRGSRNISKIADVWITLSRDKLAENELERNTTYVALEKNRFGAQTGPVCKLFFDLKTFRVEEMNDTDARLMLPPVD
jgi:twinkle protein